MCAHFISYSLGLLQWYQSQVVGDKENGVSTSGWRSKKQTIPTDSTTEAEYVAATQHTKEIVWLRKILDDLQEKQTTSTTLFVDNNSEIQLAKNINIKYHLIQYHVEAKTIQLKHCSTEEQIADIFTKALGCVKFEQF